MASKSTSSPPRIRHRERLIASASFLTTVCSQPDGAVGVEARRVAHEDLEAALVGVLGVVGAQAEAAGRAQQRVRVRRDEVEDELLGLLGRALDDHPPERRIGVRDEREVALRRERRDGCEGGRVVRREGDVFHDSFRSLRGSKYVGLRSAGLSPGWGRLSNEKTALCGLSGRPFDESRCAGGPPRRWRVRTRTQALKTAAERPFAHGRGTGRSGRSARAAPLLGGSCPVSGNCPPRRRPDRPTARTRRWVSSVTFGDHPSVTPPRCSR